MYFYGAMSHYSLWIFDQTQVISMAQSNGFNCQHWITFVESLEKFSSVLENLPESWLQQGNYSVIDEPGQQQIISAEAPLELVVHI